MRLTISGDEAASLEDLHEEVEEQILPQKSRWYQRLAWWLRAAIAEPVGYGPRMAVTGT